MTLNHCQEFQNKLSQYYLNDILSRREKYFKERDEEIRAENLRLSQLNRLAKSQRNEENERKKYLTKMQYDEYLRYQELCKIKALKNQQEKMIQQPVSLDIHSDQNLNSYRGKIQSLSNNIDRNYDQYNKYKLQRSSSCSNIYPTYKSSTSFILPRRQFEYTGVGREGTDITNKEIFDRVNNKDYDDYKEKNKEYCEFNKRLMNNCDKEREDSMMSRIYLEEKRNIQNRNYFDKVEVEERLFDNQRKRQYKEMLDEQRRTIVAEKLKNENISLEAANINPQYYKEVDVKIPNQRVKSPDLSFINKNKFVEVNPCKILIM